MATTWFVIADESRVRIFENEGRQIDLQEIKDFVSPEGRMREQDLALDAKGQHFSSSDRTGGNTAEPNVSQTQHAQELFAKEISAYLDKARLEQRYDKLRVIAFSKFLGMLRNNLSKEVQQLVEEEVSKNIAGLSEHEIEEYIRSRLH